MNRKRVIVAAFGGLFISLLSLRAGERQFAGFKTDGVFPVARWRRSGALRGSLGNGMFQGMDQNLFESRNREKRASRAESSSSNRKRFFF